jgi:hypothetical protein
MAPCKEQKLNFDGPCYQLNVKYLKRQDEDG